MVNKVIFDEEYTKYIYDNFVKKDFDDDFISYEVLIGRHFAEFNITTLTIDELYELDEDKIIYDELTKYNVFSIVSFDWDFKKKDSSYLDLTFLFNMFRYFGQRFVKEHWPDVIYYEFEREGLHKYYEEWILEVGYKKVYFKEGISIYIRENKL